jgi:hypothetical protein
MRRITCAFAVLLLGIVTPAAHAGRQSAPQTAQPMQRSTAKPVGEIRTALTQPVPAVSPGQIANCANLAAIRALDAKAAGSDYPAQSRILDLTFVLCLAGSPTAD